jgi:hypothetical protein
MARVTLEPYYLHQEHVRNLLGPDRAASAQERAASRSDPETAMPYLLAGELGHALPALGVEELARCLRERTLRHDSVVGAELDFTFRRVRDQDTPGNKPVDFTAALDVDKERRVFGTFNSVRTASSSSLQKFTGTKRLYLIGTVTRLDAVSVEVRPAFIGVRSFVNEELASGGPTRGPRVYPSEIRQFGAIDFTSTVTKAELEAIREVPEAMVKKVLAELIGEAFVPKDWGGEQSDLYTSRVFARGRQMSAGWLLKGRGHPRPMTVRALGKNGDQLVRLFKEPAELLVLQHCHEITPNLIDTIDKFAHDPRQPHFYMIFDGADTARVLKSQGLLPAGPVP